MRMKMTKTLRPLAVAASTAAIVALAGPAQACGGPPTVYVANGIDGTNKVCTYQNEVVIVGENQSDHGDYTVSFGNAFLVGDGSVSKYGNFTSYVDREGLTGKVGYRVTVYGPNGKKTFLKNIVVNWVKCNVGVS